MFQFPAQARGAAYRQAGRASVVARALSAPPAFVTGGDGTTGVLQGHNTSNAITTVGAPNGFGLFQSQSAVIVDNTIPHPNPDRSDVFLFRWNVGDAQIGGGNRSEALRFINENGTQYNESSGTFYYAVGIYAESGKYPNPQTWRIISQFHNSGGYSPPVSVNLTSDGNLQLVTSIPGRIFQRINDTVTLPRDEWVFIVLRIHWSRTGSVDMWRMRQRQDTGFVHVGRMDRDTTGGLVCDQRIGIYTEDIANASLQLRTTNYVRGTGFASVVKEAFGLTVGDFVPPDPPSQTRPALPIDDNLFTLVFEDTFDGALGTSPSAPWSFFRAFKAPADPEPWGPWRNTLYDSNHAKLDGNGNLVISGEIINGTFRTSYIHTYDLADFGNATRWEPSSGDLYIEFYCKLSEFQVSGAWLAAWLYQGDGAGEIDVMEHAHVFGGPGSWPANIPGGIINWFNVNVHGAAASEGEYLNASDFGHNLKDGNFHTFGVLWKQAGGCDFYFNGTLAKSITNAANVTTQPLGLMLSIEYQDPPDPFGFGEFITDRPPSAQYPCRFIIDDVRVYRRSSPQVSTPVILDTDLSGDVDDAGALAVVNKLHNSGECNVVAMGSCVWHGSSVSAINAINTFYGNGSIPIGKQAAGTNSSFGDGYARHLHDNFAHTQDKDNVSSSTAVYREALAAQDDNSVIFITVGPLHNVKALLDSPADGFSSLTGEQLFNAKVRSMHTMGGYYPSSPQPEWNFSAGGSGVTANVFSRVTVPVTFNGFEVGIVSGGWGAGSALNSENTATNPVAAAYWYWFKFPASWVNGGVSQDTIDDWSTWDPICVYAAIRGTSHFSLVTTGSNSIQSDGNNTWVTGVDREQQYLVQSTPAATFAKDVLEPLFLP